MIQVIGGGASLAQSAIEAALKAHETASKRIEAQLADAAGRAGASGALTPSAAADFTKALGDGLRAVNTQVNRVDALPTDLIR